MLLQIVRRIGARSERKVERKLQNLDQEVSVAQTKKRQPKQAALTRLVSELVAQVQTLVEEIAWMKRQFILQLQGNGLCEDN